MQDGTAKIFLNALGMQDDVSRELKAFLDYVAGRKPDDAFVEKLEEAVKKARKNREWRHEYMTLLMRDQENIEKGIEQGEDRLSRLYLRLAAEKRTEDLERAMRDKDFRNLLYKDYGI